MTSPSDVRVPPRYVPTLTEVVNVPAGVLPRSESVLLSDMALPPVETAQQNPVAPHAMDEPMLSLDSVVSPTNARLTEEITQRVLARLEQRLSELLEEQTAAMARNVAQAVAHRLQSELPDWVEQAVQTASHPPTRPFDVPPAVGQ